MQQIRRELPPKLLQQIYNEELKPVHPMLNTLQSGNIEKISRFSNLIIPDMDHRIFDLQQKIKLMPVNTILEEVYSQLVTEDSVVFIECSKMNMNRSI